ncbi:hypothetical protein GOODEAATRI_000290 [Goodea atripinnis]|uniref:Uncharacterized protein n=1 Tax=Goodea atripinnis TaxID=208336 RepID=A0ABV0PA40_9TELE
MLLYSSCKHVLRRGLPSQHFCSNFVFFTIYLFLLMLFVKNGMSTVLISLVNGKIFVGITAIKPFFVTAEQLCASFHWYFDDLSLVMRSKPLRFKGLLAITQIFSSLHIFKLGLLLGHTKALI